MSASQPALFNVQEFTDDGITLVGGRLYTYAYGTTTQKVAYTDPEGLVPQTYTADGLGGQYIALNVRGELPTALYLASTGSYDISLKRADGSTVWTRKASGTDNASNSLSLALSAETGTLLVGEKSPATGAIPTTVHAKFLDLGISLKADFGALGNFFPSNTNDTVAVQKFMNAQEIDTRTGFVPDGHYGVTDIECGDIETTGTRFPGFGQGPGIYHLHGTDRERCQFVALPGTSTVLRRNNLAGVKISGLGVNANSIANVGMDFSWIPTGYPTAPSNQNVFTDITVTSANILAFKADFVYDTDFRNLRLIGSPIGMSIKGTGGQHNMTNCYMTGQLICSAQNMSIIQSSLFGGVDINGNGPNFIDISGTQIFPTPVNVSIPSYKWGKAIDSSDSGTYGATLKLTSSYIFGGEGQHCIQGKFNHGITAENCEFSYGIGALMFNGIIGNGVSKPFMRLINCNMPQNGTPLGTNPAAYDWEMINCFVGGVPIKYASNRTEGTWSPVGIGISLTVNGVATWSRIGNIVNAFFDITIPSNSSTNPTYISGIPFSRVGASSSGTLGINTYATSRLTLDITGSSIVPFTTNVTIPTYQDLSGVRLKGVITYLCANPMSGA